MFDEYCRGQRKIVLEVLNDIAAYELAQIRFRYIVNELYPKWGIFRLVTGIHVRPFYEYRPIVGRRLDRINADIYGGDCGRISDDRCHL